MHDPFVVAFEIRRPWPTLTREWDGVNGARFRLASRLRPAPGSPVDAEATATRRDPFPWWRPRSWLWQPVLFGRRVWFPPLITVWHVEPDGHDSGEVCKHYRRYRDRDGTWQTRVLHGWRWHVHHWRIQVHPLQKLRRRLLTRCAWCAGRHRRRDAVNHALTWDGPRGRWWQGEPGLYHSDCASIKQARGRCLCDDPLFDMDGWGNCARCGKFRGHGIKPEHLDVQRKLAAIPDGQRESARRQP
jgi:hypothetical protein